MKQLHILNFGLLALVLTLFSSTAHTAAISIGTINDINIANNLIGTSSSAACESAQTQANCDFLTPNPTTYLNDAGVASVVTSNPANYLLSPFRNSAYIDLGFNGFDLFNGDGNDLVVFIVGHSTSFKLDVFTDASTDPFYSSVYDVATPVFDNTQNIFTDTGDMVFDNNGNWLCAGGAPGTCTDGTSLSAAFFDLGNSIAGDIALSKIRITLGEDYNGADGTRPRFSLAGGFHTNATVVPLPLSVVLFSSGLALLGLTGRRKRS